MSIAQGGGVARPFGPPSTTSPDSHYNQGVEDTPDPAAETLPADTDAVAAARDRSAAAEKVKDFPTTPGVYLMKDAAGRVIYVGKAKNLRARAGSYFLKAAAEDRRTADLVREIRDIDYLDAESEVDALLLESRLVKDVQPRFNSDLKDDKTFPYLQITTHEDFPRVEFTRTPRQKGVKLYGPFTSAGSLRGAIVVLQRIFKFRTCTLDIDAHDEQWRLFRPCIKREGVIMLSLSKSFVLLARQAGKQLSSLAMKANAVS